MLKKIVIIIFLLSIKYLTISIEEKYLEKINILNKELIKNRVDESWLLKNIENKNFKVHNEIVKLFGSSAESKVNSKEKDFEWYKNLFGLDVKIELGRKFIIENISSLVKAENINGIYYELIAAILGMETNFASNQHKGYFYVFNSLVSQYLLLPGRENFAVRELVSLYLFSAKINKDTYYFIGSYAGTCGWAQFLPSSLFAYYVDFNEDDYDIDIYSVEDSIASIENYLFKHGLNIKNINQYNSRYKAVFRYNPTDPYVKAVLYIYDALVKQRFASNEEY